MRFHAKCHASNHGIHIHMHIPHIPISDRNLLSVRMTVNARRLLRRIYGEYSTSDSQFPIALTALARNVSYGILVILRIR